MSPAVERLLDAFHARTPIRAGSLIVTVFGDAVAPRGGEVALAALLPLLAALRIGESLARTALSRLVAEGWLARERTGRTSRYALSVTGRETFARAAARIYRASARPWDGRLHLALIEAAGAAERARLRALLEADGFGAVTPDLLVSAHPGGSAPSLRLKVVAASPDEARRVTARAWPLAALDSRYSDFAARFAEARSRLAALDDPLDALVLRLLAVHEYRRIVLRDPDLPEALLPEDWAGHGARETFAAIDRATAALAKRWLDASAFPTALASARPTS